ncbi:MAG: heme biosynthesis protein HemY [Proteobacteria bacterium]|nr:heme biosynthesis protein HemY [Pseudomonadota bacterium]
MKAFRYLLVCLLLAVLGAWFWQQLATDPGQVIVSLHGTTYITTVSKAVLIVVLMTLTLWALVVLLRLPFRLWRRRQKKQAQARLTGGLLALHEGRWMRAEKWLTAAAAHAPFRATARLAAAQAAQARGDAAAAEQHLAASSEDAADPVAALTRAQTQFDSGQAADALATLDAAALKGAPPPRALLLRVQALLACQRAGEAYGMFGALKNAQVLPPAALATLEAQIATAALRESADANALADLWDHLPTPLRARAEVVAAYARRAADIGMPDAAANAIAQALGQQWDESLAALFGTLGPGRNTAPTARLDTAEGWLGAHSDSAALALTLGRLSAGIQQWGRAEDYLHRALAQGAGADAWEVLGDVHSALRDDATARQCYANALHAARGEAVQALSGRDVREQIFDAAVIEERDEHGVPRLPEDGRQRTEDRR